MYVYICICMCVYIYIHIKTCNHKKPDEALAEPGTGVWSPREEVSPME